MPDQVDRTPAAPRMVILLVISVAIGLSACARSPEPVPLETPAAAGAMLPRLSADPSGTLWLSWVEPGPDAHTLRFASLGDDGWSGARTAARGADWFVNWADFPSVVHLGEGRLAAHWLHKLEGGTYAYELLASVSTDGGAQWSAPAAPHGDGTATEHGFASLFPVPGGAGAVWLDGRNTSGGDHGDGHHSGHGAMTLRAGGLDWSGRPLPEFELDARVCDCCGTAAATSTHGVTVVYRGRSETEIRDIHAVTLGPDGWSAPAPVGDEGWEMPACPVNGPALAAQGQRLAAAWFTAAQGRPRVLAAFSSDGGLSWSEAVEVSGDGALGRVAIVMPDEASAVVSWLENTGGGAEIRYRRVPLAGRPAAARTLATTSPARSSGFPQMALAGNRLVFAWTRGGESAGIATATVPVP
ncbi:MAG: exo-alpha-sialidase [Gammaproteobacteria bacterium]